MIIKLKKENKLCQFVKDANLKKNMFSLIIQLFDVVCKSLRSRVICFVVNRRKVKMNYLLTAL